MCPSHKKNKGQLLHKIACFSVKKKSKTPRRGWHAVTQEVVIYFLH